MQQANPERLMNANRAGTPCSHRARGEPEGRAAAVGCRWSGRTRPADRAVQLLRGPCRGLDPQHGSPTAQQGPELPPARRQRHGTANRDKLGSGAGGRPRSSSVCENTRCAAPQLGLQQHTQPAAGSPHKSNTPPRRNLWGSTTRVTSLPQTHTRRDGHGSERSRGNDL